MLDRQIPLLRIGQAIRIDGPIDRRELAVHESLVQERRAREILRRTVAQSERRNQSALRTGKRRGGVKTVLADSASPAGNIARINEDAVAEPHDCLFSR